MKKILAAVLALWMMTGAALAQEGRIGILVPQGEAEGAAAAYWAEARAIELGIEYMLCVCEDEKTGLEQLDDMNVWGAEAIVLYPKFEGAQNLADQARDVGLSVVSVDMALDGAFLADADDYDIGVKCAYAVADALEGAGEIAALVTEEAGAQERLMGFTDALEEMAPNVNVVEVSIVPQSRAKSREAAENLLAARESLDGIFVSDDSMALGVWDALDAAGRTDVCAVISCGGRQEWLRLIADSGDVNLFTALRTAAMAEDAVDMAYVLSRGEAAESVRISDAQLVGREEAGAYLDEENQY